MRYLRDIYPGNEWCEPAIHNTMYMTPIASISRFRYSLALTYNVIVKISV